MANFIMEYLVKIIEPLVLLLLFIIDRDFYDQLQHQLTALIV